MIVDCHAHVFENWHGACGHPSIDVHLKYIQKNVTRPAAEAFRVRDGKRVKPGLLFREGGNPLVDNTWQGLKDVGFRIGRYGRLEFMHEGEEYAIQYMPVGMQEMAAPPELMLAQMTYAGVVHRAHGRLVVHVGVGRDHALGHDLTDLGRCRHQALIEHAAYHVALGEDPGELGAVLHDHDADVVVAH